MSNNAFDNFKAKWAAMKPGARHRATLALMVGAFAAIASLGYFVSGGAEKNKAANVRVPSLEKKNITLDPKMLERSITHETNKNADEIADLKKQIDDLKKGGSGAPGAPPAGVITQDPKLGQGAMPGGMPGTLAELQLQQKSGVPMAHGSAQKAQHSAPVSGMPPLPPPQPAVAANRVPPPPGAGGNVGMQQGKPAEVMVGDIEVVSAPKNDKKESEGKKKEKAEIYLPPSFMEADLLTGLNAPATETGRNNPLPVLIRIKKLAILPNKLKADLKGCFIIAEGHGNLADERAHLRLVNLSCVSKNGEAVIDQSVTGAVYDSDGKLGLTGRVVSRMGASIVRSLIAGFFGGFGEAMKQSSQFTSLTALGAVTTPTTNIDKMAVAGAGQGISDAAKEIQKFYLDLAKQAVPVIEVSGARHITLAITKGVKLEVRDAKTNAH